MDLVHKGSDTAPARVFPGISVVIMAHLRQEKPSA
jgi:hypothetical protein